MKCVGQWMWYTPAVNGMPGKVKLCWMYALAARTRRRRSRSGRMDMCRCWG